MVMGYGIISSVWFIRILFSSHLFSHVLNFSCCFFFLFSFFIQVFSQSRKSAFLFISLAGHWTLGIRFFIFVCRLHVTRISFVVFCPCHLFLSVSIFYAKRTKCINKNKNNFKLNCLVVGVFFFSSGFSVPVRDFMVDHYLLT